VKGPWEDRFQAGGGKVVWIRSASDPTLHSLNRREMLRRRRPFEATSLSLAAVMRSARRSSRSLLAETMPTSAFTAAIGSDIGACGRSPGASSSGASSGSSLEEPASPHASYAEQIVT